MNIKNRMIFAVLSFSIVALIMTAYNNTIQPTYIATYAQENEAEVEADIEQENKCKKDTECENENELNNQLTITNNTQTQSESQATLTVTKTLTCIPSGVSPDFCEGIGPEDAQITVTGNNPNPSEFPGSPEGTLVTLGAGDYIVSEIVIVPDGPYDASIGATTIAAGESQTCNIANIVTLID